MWGDLKGDQRYCYGCQSSDHWGCDCPRDPAGPNGRQVQEQMRATAIARTKKEREAATQEERLVRLEQEVLCLRKEIAELRGA